MRRMLSLLWVACSMILIGCDQTSTAAPQTDSQLDQAVNLRNNNAALVANLVALRDAIAARNSLVAGRSAAALPAEAGVDFETIKIQVKTSLQASGACQPWIDFVVSLFDLLEELLTADTSQWTSAEFQTWQNDLMELFSRAISCLEPLLTDVSGTDADPLLVMSNLQSFDQCICGAGGGSIFGTSAALVYSTFAAPTTGTTYQAPSAAGGTTYSSPGSAGGDPYGAPSLFP